MTPLIKISAPSVSDVFPRKRVFRILDDCMRYPVVWVASPAGSGKTTLIASYLEERGIPCLWYRADTGDGDIATFFYYMGLAVKKAAPRFRKSLPLLSPEYLPGISIFARRYFEDLYRRLVPPFAVVLDNYQEIPAGSVLHEIVKIGLSSVPEGISAIVISRNIAPQNFARMRANNEMEMLGWDEIRLTEEETRKIARARNERRLDDQTISALHKKTEGWVAGLVLLIESSKGRSLNFGLPESFTPDDIFRYFASEIFDKTDQETREFLLLTSFLPAMTAHMAEALTGTRAAGRLLQTLHEQNYFTERRSGEHPVYSYHALFRDFIKARAGKVFSWERMAEIQRKAAAVLMESGQAEDAACLLIDARAWNEFVPFVINRAHSVISQGRSKTLEAWLACIPEKIAESAPWVLYWLGACRLGISPGESRALFDRAFHLFESMGDEAGVLSAWSGAVDTFFFEFADFRPLDERISWLDARMRHGVSFPAVEVEARVAASMTGALVWRMPDHLDMRKWVNRSLSLSERGLNVDGRIRAYLDIALYYLWMGDFSECTLMVDQVRKMTLARSASPLMFITSKVAEGLVLGSHIDSFEHALQLVASGLKKAEETGVHVMDFHLLALGVLSAMNKGDITLVRKYLAAMEKIIDSERVVESSMFQHLSAWASLLLGNGRRAVALAGKSVQLAEKGGILFPEAFNRLVLTIGLCETKDFEEADRQLERIRGIAARTGSSHLEYLHHLAQAHCAFARQENGAGIEALRRAMTLGRQKDYSVLVTFLRPDHMSRLCVRALTAGIEVEYVQELVRRQGLYPEDSAAEIENWPWPVMINTLGRFSLVINGKTETPSGKSQKKPVLLLKVMIALGAKDVREEQLADILWPDADGDAGHNAMKTTVARLRRIIGNEAAVQVREGRVSLDNRYCWVDTWAFERLCTRAEEIMERAGGNTLLTQIVSRAFGLYRGPFLHSDTDQTWTVGARERLRSRYLRLISRIARRCEQANDLEAAAEYYLKGLDAEPLAEEFHQGLMRSYFRLGRHAEALAAYRRCRKLLQSELEITPSSRTEALKAEILKAGKL